MRAQDILLKKIKKELDEYVWYDCKHCWYYRLYGGNNTRCKGKKNFEEASPGLSRFFTGCNFFKPDSKYTDAVAEKIRDLALDYAHGKIKVPKNKPTPAKEEELDYGN